MNTDEKIRNSFTKDDVLAVTKLHCGYYLQNLGIDKVSLVLSSTRNVPNLNKDFDDSFREKVAPAAPDSREAVEQEQATGSGGQQNYINHVAEDEQTQ